MKCHNNLFATLSIAFVGLAPAAVAAEVQGPILTVQDCDGLETNFENPSAGEPLMTFTPDSCHEFQSWQVVSGDAQLDALNPTLVILILPLQSDSTIRAQCVRLCELPVPDPPPTDEPGQPAPDDEELDTVAERPLAPANCGNCGMGAGPAALFCSLTWGAASLFSQRRRKR
ncbi:MAG TPA: hypothetical protein VLM89_12875 [Phycisphaerae bacterium]|nr:hypothetical protein [Phycisphaerae bacterium]